jgi:hypothetical protein
MKKILIKFLLFLLHKLGVSMIDTPDATLLNSVVVEVNRADEVYPETSGEYKRHQVYSRLIKTYPKISKKDLGYVIEAALRVRT